MEDLKKELAELGIATDDAANSAVSIDDGLSHNHEKHHKA